MDDDIGVKLTKLMIGLSAFAVVASAFQAFRYQKIWPYIHGFAIGSWYLIPSSILTALAKSYYDEDLVTMISVSTFFSTTAPFLLWILLFDTFRVIASPSGGRKKLAGTYFGYLYSIVMIITTIGVIVSASNGSGKLSVLIRTTKFLDLGGWALFAPLLFQLYFSYHDVRHILPTVALYSFLLFCIHMGLSIGYMPLNNPDEEAATIAAFVLVHYVGIFALLIVLSVAHTWTQASSENLDKGDQQVYVRDVRNVDEEKQ